MDPDTLHYGGSGPNPGGRGSYSEVNITLNHQVDHCRNLYKDRNQKPTLPVVLGIGILAPSPNHPNLCILLAKHQWYLCWESGLRA